MSRAREFGDGSGQSDNVVASVVLLHGQPGQGAWWNPVRDRLTPGYRVLAPDRPGYGANPEPARGLAGNVDWLIGLLDRYRIDRAVLVGHSWAGGVAALAGARHPDRVAGLVLAASIGPECLRGADRPLAWPILGDLAAYVALGIGRPVYRYLMRRRYRTAAPPGRSVWRGFVTEQRALVADLSMVTAELDRIEAPTVVLAGTRDRVIPRHCPHLLADRIPGATARRVPGAGHDLPGQAPAAVAWAVREVGRMARSRA